jgi:hypothetical protein
LRNPDQMINVELDVEVRLKAQILKDRIRLKQFFQDFDRLRKGTVGEAAVSRDLYLLSLMASFNYDSY